MGTRGFYGFKKDGEYKVTYNHFDSYPDGGLGEDVVRFCESTSTGEMKKIFDEIEMIGQNIDPTEEQIKNCVPWTDLSVSNQSTSDWYCLLRKAQGDLEAYKNGLKYMKDDSWALTEKDTWLEYGYVINLDDDTLDFYTYMGSEPDLKIPFERLDGAVQEMVDFEGGE